MSDQKKIIECPCGVILEGESDDAVVIAAMSHASKVHDMDLTRDQALEMARPA
jgi:predicted small metal-binding protein